MKHKDAVSTKDDANDVEQSPSELIVPEVEQWTPSLERRLQRALRDSLDKLEPGLVAIDGGREDGFRDITAKDQAGNTVVIELKAGKAGKDAVAQLLAYMGEIKAGLNPSGLRGILVAYDFQANAVAIVSVVPTIALKRYPSDVRNSVAANPPTSDAANGVTTFHDRAGRVTGTARTDSNGVTTFHDAAGRVTGKAR